ncbi:MAG TPA: hypothetical protein VH092_13795 [Urbifossiella sp.]|jgi:hypothetical protein|nr:hypothetical protein [Urbifossiella sp.]
MTHTFRLPALVLAAAGLFGSAAPASAAWNNVFQVCCHDCQQPRSSYSVPAPAPAAACPTCPQPEVRVSYVQRSYYQPVTEYVRRSYYEPVTRNVTSYYYEPVTEYKYTTYYDPCTGCPQRVCQPTTSYRIRSKCNAVTSYVERCAMVPVTSLRPVTVRQPVVTYYYPPEPSCPPTAGASPIPAPAGPAVDELRSPPTVVPSTPGATGDNLPPMTLPTGPNTAYPRTGPAPALPPANPRLRPDRTTSRSSVVTVRGEVVERDQMTPRSAARVVFVSADNPERREYATANGFGEFDLRLPAGNWYVYLGGTDGRAVYHKQVTLGDREAVDYRVVSR